MTNQASNEARVLPLRPQPADRPAPPQRRAPAPRPAVIPPGRGSTAPAPREPLWRDLVGEVLRNERLTQERTLKDVADAARISMPYLSEVERGRKEASSEVLAAAAHALGLSLGDLLARAHGELVRITSRHTAAGRGVSASPHSSRASHTSHGGLCLAA
ncbi:helix-turn-helix domain-containing protein [Streptomyces bullii]|uniref:Helix-turn-helix domain-containing protein n=1 Tax=Streptomyces bullii TaxID=349910 RepID=A0ABW0UHP2_9ACTN